MRPYVLDKGHGVFTATHGLALQHVIVTPVGIVVPLLLHWHLFL